MKRVWAWGRRYLLAALVVALVGLLAALMAALFDIGLPWMLSRLGIPAESPNEPTGKFTVLASIATVMGGVLIAIGVAVANRRAVAMEETAKAQVQVAEAQVEANRGAEDGRRQERLKNAIGHLGHDSVSARLGGAYELFHLAKDTEDLRQTVLDILCAHIRQTTGKTGYREEHESKPSEEIQSLLTLLFVQEYEVFKGCSINLQGSWLNGANLDLAHMQGANLINVCLQIASLHKAQLQGVTLHYAQLQGATLLSAQLRGADLFEAKLQGARLFCTYLQGAYLFGAHLQGSTLVNAQLQGANLFWAELQGANLFSARLQGAYLFGVQLHGVICEFTTGSPFEAHIRTRIDQESDLSEVIFSGGLNREDADSLVEDMPDTEAKELRQKLEPHIDRPPSHEPPEDSGVITGSYTTEEAERWIAEYESSMRGVPEP